MLRWTANDSTQKDTIRIPHRTLTPAEMVALFDEVDAQLAAFYSPLAHEVTQALDEAGAQFAKAKAEHAANPRRAQLEAEWATLATSTPTDELRERFKAVHAELRTLRRPVEEAEAALKEADRTNSQFISEEDAAVRILGYLAGQRSGLRAGIRLAARFLTGSDRLNTTTIKGDDAVLLAAAMIDDAEADALIGRILGTQPQAMREGAA